MVSASRMNPDATELTIERVLRLVEALPSGSVTTYGDLGRALGTNARMVGRIMSTVGGSVAWWRVVNARGTLPDHLVASASAHWRQESIPLAGPGRVALSRCRLGATTLVSLARDSPPG
ncbi:MAG: MGMT family protein [Arachnia sp.]